MTDKWGPPIRVDGVKPDWLGASEGGLFENRTDRWLDDDGTPLSEWCWESGVTPIHIRVRADHPYYTSTPDPVEASEPLQDPYGVHRNSGVGYPDIPIPGNTFADGVRAAIAALPALRFDFGGSGAYNLAIVESQTTLQRLLPAPDPVEEVVAAFASDDSDAGASTVFAGNEWIVAHFARWLRANPEMIERLERG